MLLSKRNVQWLIEHTYLDDDGIVRCDRTHEPISMAHVRRSLWFPHMIGGMGEVRTVTDLACLECNPYAQPPRDGSGIYENEIVNVPELCDLSD